ncbi:hypothetical protein [Methylomonas sp. TEB]|uniref:hypothetical protein n=1 Tax=Methylomonas sp. TEB TaxID=3398229 RepID=UPI0039F5BE16
MNYNEVSDTDKTNLVDIILETSTTPLDFDLFAELIGTLSEDIPGLELLSETGLANLIADCWQIYLSQSVAP